MPDITITVTPGQMEGIRWRTRQVNAARARQGLPALTSQEVFAAETFRRLDAYVEENLKERKIRRGDAYFSSDPTVQQQVDTLLNVTDP